MLDADIWTVRAWKLACGGAGWKDLERALQLMALSGGHIVLLCRRFGFFLRKTVGLAQVEREDVCVYMMGVVVEGRHVSCLTSVCTSKLEKKCAPP